MKERVKLSDDEYQIMHRSETKNRLQDLVAKKKLVTFEGAVSESPLQNYFSNILRTKTDDFCGFP